MKTVLSDYLKNQLKKISPKKINLNEVDIHPLTNQNLGDYTTNIAFKIAKKVNSSPKKIADELINKIPHDYFKKIDSVNGFINFWLKEKIIFEKISYLKNNYFQPKLFFFGSSKKIVIEYAHPNTHKLFHIGHLRNIITGESLSRTFEFLGNKVIRANYQGDIGLHIAKTLYALLLNKKKYHAIKKDKNLEKKIDFIGQMYTLGNQQYEKDESAKREIKKINQLLYKKESQVYSLWRQTRLWSLDYFNDIYKKLDTHFDKLYFESQTAQEANKYINLALKKGVLEKSQGAIIFNGKRYKLDTRVFLNSLGYPTYEGKEIPLAYWQFNDFGEIDKCIHLTTPEQKSFFSVTFKVEELLYPKIKGKQHHLTYEWVNLKTGKMSSREGNIIETNWLINEVKNRILANYKINPKRAHLLSIACIKYSFLKNSLSTKINFDIEESINLHGNSAAYLIYAFVRCQAIIKKTKPIGEKNFLINPEELSPEEKNLARFLYFFEDIVYQSGVSFSPQFLATYLYQLAQKFNFFYEKHPVLKADKKLKNFRINLVLATANVLTKGLTLLGIKTVNKM